MSQDCLPWNSDCLNVITILATAFDTKKLKRFSRRFGLYEKGVDPDVVDLFQRFHEMCHRDVEFAKSIGKDLDDRFRSTVHRVRSSKPEEVLNMEMNWPIPLLWATLTDEREPVRLHARRLLHGLLWNVLRRLPSMKNDDEDLRNSICLLEEKVKVQAAELAGMGQELHEKKSEAERLKGVLRGIECRHSGIERAESGEGRLKREIRKLQHDLKEERERTRTFSKIIEQARLFPPDDLSSGASDEGGAGNHTGCPFEERELPACPEHCANTNEICNRCPLQGQRVAVIGGICRMLPAYRKVVRDLGAELLFHDGEVKNGSHRLKGFVCGADIVVFITSVNSHGALNAVKDVCRRNGKKFIALKETGAESLGRKLRLAAA